MTSFRVPAEGLHASSAPTPASRTNRRCPNTATHSPGASAEDRHQSPALPVRPGGQMPRIRPRTPRASRFQELPPEPTAMERSSRSRHAIAGHPAGEQILAADRTWPCRASTLGEREDHNTRTRRRSSTISSTSKRPTPAARRTTRPGCHHGPMVPPSRSPICRFDSAGAPPAQPIRRARPRSRGS